MISRAQAISVVNGFEGACMAGMPVARATVLREYARREAASALSARSAVKNNASATPKLADRTDR